jgi:predicted O-linked N-acetylglucosamine transferase (SPINDLY family)
MVNDTLAPTLDRPAARNLSILDLIQTAEAMRRSDGLGAVQALYAAWIEHNQDHPLLYSMLFNYAVTLSDSGDLHPARECFERAIALNPDFMPAHINLGRVHERLGAAGLAVQQWSAMLEKMAPVNGAAITYKTTALVQTARVLEAANQDERAEAMLRQTLEIDCHQREAVQHFISMRQRQCEWPVVSPWDRVDRRTLMTAMSPLSAAAYTDDPMLHLASAWNYNRLDVGTPASAIVASHWAAQRSGPLRIGYLSSDLREHAVGHLMAEIFELHDRGAVEVFAYYCGIEINDAMHANFIASADHWVSISGLDDAAAARRIADDGIQILIDLNGYTREGRTKLVALRPAPVIVNWLGYPGTMGSPYHHYILADDWIIPEDHEAYYSEQVLRLPCYQPNNRKRAVSPRQPSRSEAGLPEDATVYCCFNGTHKITRFTFERWLAILARVPRSVLWLLTASEATKERLQRHAARHGIAPERVIFAEKLPNVDHLARYALADLFLDTTPYGAHTTASDALWMGLPVLTFSGRSFASRVCGSLVRSAGLPEMVCASAEEFTDRAVALGRDPALLRRYRERLQANRGSCILFDTPLLVRSLEALYGQMWDAFQKGALPRPDLSNLDVYLDLASAMDHDAAEVQAVADYRGWWLERLAHHHRFRPIQTDRRLFTDPGSERRAGNGP